MKPVAIQASGMVTAVGLNAPASCAAIRARLANPTETLFIDRNGEPLMAHCVPLDKPCRGLARLGTLAVMAIQECLTNVPRQRWGTIPAILCLAEPERPGRLEALGEALFEKIQQEIGARFESNSAIIAGGRTSAVLALVQARKLIYERNIPQVLIVACDTLLRYATLSCYESKDRLLTADNSNGFMPGEGAGALLVGAPTGNRQLLCVGLGLAQENAHIESEQPMRADGLTAAHKAALADAGCAMHDLDFRITDLCGEQYYFKEADIALSRLLRVRKEDPELWHPAEYTGACGAALGTICLSVAQSAVTKDYAPGRGILLHFSDDAGQRASIVAFPG